MFNTLLRLPNVGDVRSNFALRTVKAAGRSRSEQRARVVLRQPPRLGVAESLAQQQVRSRRRACTRACPDARRRPGRTPVPAHQPARHVARRRPVAAHQRADVDLEQCAAVGQPRRMPALRGSIWKLRSGWATRRRSRASAGGRPPRGTPRRALERALEEQPAPARRALGDELEVVAPGAPAPPDGRARRPRGCARRARRRPRSRHDLRAPAGELGDPHDPGTRPLDVRRARDVTHACGVEPPDVRDAPPRGRRSRRRCRGGDGSADPRTSPTTVRRRRSGPFAGHARFTPRVDTDRMFPAGSLNQAIGGPPPSRETPFSSWPKPS